jgi:hypothetical protein
LIVLLHLVHVTANALNPSTQVSCLDCRNHILDRDIALHYALIMGMRGINPINLFSYQL